MIVANDLCKKGTFIYDALGRKEAGATPVTSVAELFDHQYVTCFGTIKRVYDNLLLRNQMCEYCGDIWRYYTSSTAGGGGSFKDRHRRCELL